MAHRAFLLYSTVQVKCPKAYSEESAESGAEALRSLLEDYADDLEKKIQDIDPQLKIKVVH